MVFVIIGGLVLLTLFIGVVSTSMDEAQENQKQEKELEESVKEFAKENNIASQEVELYTQVFNMLDLDGGGTIEEEELRMGLKAVGKNPTNEELSEMMRQVDSDESGEIDIAEFVEFMYNMKKEKREKAAFEASMKEGADEREDGDGNGDGDGDGEGEDEADVVNLVVKKKNAAGGDSNGGGETKKKVAVVAVSNE